MKRWDIDIYFYSLRIKAVEYIDKNCDYYMKIIHSADTVFIS